MAPRNRPYQRFKTHLNISKGPQRGAVRPLPKDSGRPLIDILLDALHSRATEDAAAERQLNRGRRVDTSATRNSKARKQFE